MNYKTKYLNTLSIVTSRLSASIKSILLSTTIILSHVISPMTRHSAVCVWTPFVMSTTNSIISMICAPPMIVRMSDECPGQSTNVNCTCEDSSVRGKCCGLGMWAHEKPKSIVMPRSRLWRLLSNAEVDEVVLNAFANDVLPLSMWPKQPTLMLIIVSEHNQWIIKCKQT